LLPVVIILYLALLSCTLVAWRSW